MGRSGWRQEWVENGPKTSMGNRTLAETHRWRPIDVSEAIRGTNSASRD